MLSGFLDDCTGDDSLCSHTREVLQVRIHHSNLFFSDYSEIIIYGFKYSFENIIALLRPFSFKLAVVTIDSLLRSSDVYRIIDSLSIEYKYSNSSPNSEAISMIVSANNLSDLIKTVSNEEAENLYVTALDGEKSANVLNQTPKELLNNGLSNVFLILSKDENTAYLSFNKKVYKDSFVLNSIKRECKD